MNVSDIEAARWQEQKRLEALRTPLERNRMGQFSTPFALAQEIVQYVAKQYLNPVGPLRFLEPSVGTGVFYSALRHIVPAHKVAKAIGIEIDAQVANVAKELWGSDGLQVIEGDFTTLQPTSDRFHLVLANPPYIRHHHIPTVQKLALQHRIQAEVGYKLHGLSGLYCAFILLAHQWLADDGIAAWLIPSEFMDVNYGGVLRRYLTERVTLIRVHQSDPDDLQFEEALVSSTIVVYRKAIPLPDHEVCVSMGGSLFAPSSQQMISVGQLRQHHKWTHIATPVVREISTESQPYLRLGDLFDIKRGIATGANDFFILTRDEADKRQLPGRFLRPILPSPRYLHEPIIEAEPDGFPKVVPQHVLLDCPLALDKVAQEYPSLAAYYVEGQLRGLDKRYLAANRTPWYRQEQRSPAPFLCTYMGRNLETRGAFRFFWNRSKALAPNVYLLLYPKPVLEDILRDHREMSAQIFRQLQRIDIWALLREGRTYGGALHKIEPKELERVILMGLEEIGPSTKQLTLF